MKKKPQKKKKQIPEKETSRTAIQRALDDDLILELHFQGSSLRDIARVMKISHVAVGKRIEKMLNLITEKTGQDTETLRKIMIRSHEHTIKRAWQFVFLGNEFSFKYLDVITNVKKEIAKLQNLYHNTKEGDKKPRNFESIVEDAWNDE